MSQPRQSRRGGRGGRGGKWNKDEGSDSSGPPTRPSSAKSNPFQANRSLVNGNPTAPGFKQRNRAACPTPDFLIQDSRSVKNIQWRVDPWDLANQQEMLKVEEQMGHGDLQSLYERVSRIEPISFIIRSIQIWLNLDAGTRSC
jgi:hypothetical protein